MVRLIAVTQAEQDGYGLFARGFADCNGLEPPFKRCVFFDMPAVFVERCRPDDLDFSARESGLKDVGSVDAALRCACADDGMQLVDKQDSAAVLP